MTKTINISKVEIKDTQFGKVYDVYDGKDKYSFFSTKKDNTPTKAVEQFKQFQLGVGIVVQAEVEETADSFVGQNNKTIPITRRKILYFLSDEHGVPHQRETPKVVGTAVTDWTDKAPTQLDRIEAMVEQIVDSMLK